jgi:hypothetical protein
MLGNEDIACFLNGFSALWHPAALLGAAGPPRVGSPYDHEQPSAGHIYAVPESPPLVLPEDWDQRVRAAGAVAFRASPDRTATLANLKEALKASANGEQITGLLEIDLARVRPFFGIGFGHCMIEALFEAMSHENVLAASDFWQDVQAAVTNLSDTDPEAYRRSLQSAADRLQTAREVLYPVSIHLLDICLLDERQPGRSLPVSLEMGIPCNAIGTAAVLQKLAEEDQASLALLRERLRDDRAEVCGGCCVEREDALLPLESQMWNLLKGLAVSKELLDQEIRVYARKRFAAHPQLPMFLNSAGLRRALLLAFDEAVLPTYRVTVVNWPSPDGKQVEAFTRPPHPADNPQTYFHWAHYLHKTIAEDHAATLALLHRGTPASPWYTDLLELCRFGPVLGQWTTLSRYLGEVMAGEYASAGSADDFHGDYLTDRTNAHLDQPVSWFARQARLRRRLDLVWSLAALSRGLSGPRDPLRLESRLSSLEDHFETHGEERETLQALAEIEKEAAGALAERLQARSTEGTPGYLLLNPCSFTRRVALELDGFAGPLPTTGPVKACQVDGDKGRLVVEVPAFGFAWMPNPSAAAIESSVPRSRMRLADPKTVRNEFFEAEIDPATGGLRGLRDYRTRVSRVGQQLVFNPGSTMRAKEVKVTSTGPALGEVVSEGAILDEHDQVLALFRQRFRAWLGRPMLELRIEIYPQHQPQGYPWHAYYGARFAWRDERAALLRGVNGTSFLTSHTRPETPDYLELRSGRQSTVLFPGGLPFHQRHGGRMLDIILVPEGEAAQVFELGLGIDRDYPMQTALGMITPVAIVPTSKGPPHVGAAGWLFHLDAPNLLLTSIRPDPGGADAVIARLLECSQNTGSAELHCVRDPKRAVMMDALGTAQMEAHTSGDTVFFDVSASDLAHLRVEFQ